MMTSLAMAELGTNQPITATARSNQRASPRKSGHSRSAFSYGRSRLYGQVWRLALSEEGTRQNVPRTRRTCRADSEERAFGSVVTMF
jgi:hypothetical protein